MKSFFHAKSSISGFYHHLVRNATEVSDERSLVVCEKFVLKNRVVSETHQEDGIVVGDCMSLSMR